MAKEFIIHTSRLLPGGFRILTSGVNIEQFKRNPILLFMHRRAWDPDVLPIGRVENIRVEGDQIIGTPIFDESDPFALRIKNKWDNGFMCMASAGIEPIERSEEPEYLLPGQTRATVTKSKLVEVSIVDIGANDDAIKLYNEGKIIELSAGSDNEFIPLLKTEENPPEAQDDEGNNKPQNNSQMKQILLALGLSETATEDQAVEKVNALKKEAEKAATIELSRITGRVDAAIEKNLITAAKREHFITLGKTAGFETLDETLNMFKPIQKPTDVINQGGDGKETIELKFSDLTKEKAEEMRENDREGYIKLYRQEFGFDPQF